MLDKSNVKLADLIDQKNSRAVIDAVAKIFSYSYDAEEFIEIERCYDKVFTVFEGKFPGYKACNTNYHNFSHTLDALLATARLIDGYNISEKVLPVKLVINLLKSALLHDIGYIQENDDEGTGAKYTANHVTRSVEFISIHHAEFGIKPDELETISNIVRSTGLKINLKEVSFKSDEERFAGYFMGTGDILGQMADREYLEKLLFLYYEFHEAGIPGYNTEFDIIKNTLKFYEEIKERIGAMYQFSYQYARHHFNKRYDIDENIYMTAIDRNIEYIKKIVDEKKTNFRHKLKRGHLVGG